SPIASGARGPGQQKRCGTLHCHAECGAQFCDILRLLLLTHAQSIGDQHPTMITIVAVDNRSKRRRNEKTTKQDFTIFAERRENQRIHISPQLTLATFQYLSTTVDAFKPEIISETILRRLLKQDVIYHIKVKNRDKARHDPQCVIYSQGKPVDYFVLVLEGRVEVTVGKENMMFESGPFTYFGTQALIQNIGVGECMSFLRFLPCLLLNPSRGMF
ncbi:hypothetical protein C0J52_17274, partial [Blattella germanica]